MKPSEADRQKAVLSTHGLEVGYGRGGDTKGGRVSVLSGISISLTAGEIVCVIGTNGSGKSTLLRTISGMQQPLSGEVSVLGQPVHTMRPGRRATLVSVVLTERIDAGYLDVFTLVSLGRHPYTGWSGTLREADIAAVTRSIEELGIGHLAYRPVARLSDGERQKAFIARALAQDTPLIILDEPTAFLDVPGRADMFQLLRTLAERTGKTVLLSTHDLDLALRSADRMLLISPDRQLADGAPEDLVIRGAFARAFRDQNVEFDSHTARFELNRPHRARVQLSGDGPALEWTARALNRAGFEIAGPTGNHGATTSQHGEEPPGAEVRGAPIASVTVETDAAGRANDGESQAAVRWRVAWADGASEAASIYELLGCLNSLLRDQ